jgi:hypothetical protein
MIKVHKENKPKLKIKKSLARNVLHCSNARYSGGINGRTVVQGHPKAKA